MTEYFDTAICVSRPQLKNFLLGSSPVTSQPHHVRRHSVACRVFRLNSSLRHAVNKAALLQFGKSAPAVPRAMLHRSEARRIESPSLPLFVPSWPLAISIRTARAGQVREAGESNIHRYRNVGAPRRLFLLGRFGMTIPHNAQNTVRDCSRGREGIRPMLLEHTHLSHQV